MNSHGKNRKGYKAICGRIWLPLPLLLHVSHRERGPAGQHSARAEEVIYATRIRADDLHFWLRRRLRRYMNALQHEEEKK